MKFLAFSDTHTSVIIHQKIVKFAQDYDVDFLVCTGDFTIYCNYWEQSLRELAKARLKVLFTPGNHEYHPDVLKKINGYDFIVNLDRNIFVTENFAFIGYGAQNFPKEIRFDFWQRKWLKFKSRDKSIVFLPHVPPWGTPVAINKYGRDIGSSCTLRWIKDLKPSAVLCGHVHEPQKRMCEINESKIFNIACQCHLFEITKRDIQLLKNLPIGF